jgi:hypothetical protein
MRLEYHSLQGLRSLTPGWQIDVLGRPPESVKDGREVVLHETNVVDGTRNEDVNYTMSIECVSEGCAAGPGEIQLISSPWLRPMSGVLHHLWMPCYWYFLCMHNCIGLHKNIVLAQNSMLL